MLTDNQKIKILELSGKELLREVWTNEKLTFKQKNEIFSFWLDQHNQKINDKQIKPLR